MYDENKWNEGNHENEMKHTEQPVNAQDSQSSQNTRKTWFRHAEWSAV